MGGNIHKYKIGLIILSARAQMVCALMDNVWTTVAGTTQPRGYPECNEHCLLSAAEMPRDA